MCYSIANKQTNKLHHVRLKIKHPTHNIHLCDALWLSYESISHGTLNKSVEESLWFACSTFFLSWLDLVLSRSLTCLSDVSSPTTLSTSKQISLIVWYDFKGWLFFPLLVVKISILSCLTVKSMHLAPGNLSSPLPPPPPGRLHKGNQKRALTSTSSVKLGYQHPHDLLLIFLYSEKTFLCFCPEAEISEVFTVA